MFRSLLSRPISHSALLLVLTFAINAYSDSTVKKTGDVPADSPASSTTETEEEGSGIFKQVDKDGRVIFTDNPNRERADKEVRLKDLNTHSGKDATPTFTTKKAADEKEETKAIDYKVWIQSPQNDHTIGPADDAVNVEVGVNRYVPHFIRIQLYWDGEPYGSPQISRNFSIPVNNLKSRGQRRLHTELIDTHTGEILARSPEVHVYVIRP